jgi:hypothetical protein
MYEQIIKSMKELTQKEIAKEAQTPDPMTASVRFGTVTSIATGLKVMLDGEAAASGRNYPRISSYFPTIGDRVMMHRDKGGVWVVSGRIETNSGSPFTPLALENGWQNYDPAGSSWESAGYMRDAMGFVHVRGLIAHGSMTTSAAILPPGFRPRLTVMFATIDGGNSIGRVDVLPNGIILPQTGNPGYYSLSVISFFAEL